MSAVFHKYQQNEAKLANIWSKKLEQKYTWFFMLIDCNKLFCCRYAAESAGFPKEVIESAREVKALLHRKNPSTPSVEVQEMTSSKVLLYLQCKFIPVDSQNVSCLSWFYLSAIDVAQSWNFNQKPGSFYSGWTGNESSSCKHQIKGLCSFALFERKIIEHRLARLNDDTLRDAKNGSL